MASQPERFPENCGLLARQQSASASRYTYLVCGGLRPYILNSGTRGDYAENHT